jgi:hypothetical protein
MVEARVEYIVALVRNHYLNDWYVYDSKEKALDMLRLRAEPLNISFGKGSVLITQEDEQEFLWHGTDLHWTFEGPDGTIYCLQIGSKLRG